MSWFKKNFLNDDDGLSAKDYLMLVFTTPYVVAWVAVLVMAVIGRPMTDQVVDILQLLSPAVMTIIGGWFGVQAVTEFANRNKTPSNSTDTPVYPTEDDPPIYP